MGVPASSRYQVGIDRSTGMKLGINGEKGDALRLRDECKKAIMLHTTLEQSKVELYKISIDRSTGMKLGIIVRQDGEALLLNAITGGLFLKWNRENPDQQVAI